MISTKPRCAPRVADRIPRCPSLTVPACTDTKAQVDRPNNGSGRDCRAERRPFRNSPSGLGRAL